MTSNLTTQVLARLDRVLDPCSCMTDTPMSIVELGLVESIEVDDDAGDGVSVDVELVPTSPMCLYMTQIIDEAEAEIGTLDAVDAVRVTQTLETLWRPERMDGERLQAAAERYGGARDVSNTP